MIVRSFQIALLVLIQHKIQTLFSPQLPVYFFGENLNRQIFSSRGNLVVETKDFVLCIGILLVQECQTTVNEFDDFFTNSNY